MGWSANWNIESTKASKSLTEAFFILWETSSCMESCFNSFNNGCILKTSTISFILNQVLTNKTCLIYRVNMIIEPISMFLNWSCKSDEEKLELLTLQGEDKLVLKRSMFWKREGLLCTEQFTWKAIVDVFVILNSSSLNDRLATYAQLILYLYVGFISVQNIVLRPGPKPRFRVLTKSPGRLG